MKYLRKFNTRAEYENFILTTTDFPNLCLINSEKIVEYNISSPLYIEAIEDLTVSFSNTYEYSLDTFTWTNGDSNTIIPVVAGEKVYFRTSGLSTSSFKGIGEFTISNGKCNIGGNIMSMTYGDDFLAKTTIGTRFQFAGLFKSCVGIVNAINLFLPATTLADGCYYYMFNGCTSLITAPKLYATTLSEFCYDGMFKGCTSLTTAPTLPATTLDDYCYDSMFSGCTSLTTAPSLPATTLANECYAGMFNGCTSLTTAPALPATTLRGSCYQSMFNGCTSLTTAPALPATSLASECYKYMFSGCKALTTAPSLPSTSLANECYAGMFQVCTNLTTAPTLPATTLDDYCYEGMFAGCTNLTSAPTLPATTLADYCYRSMFKGCTKLTTAPSLPATTLANECYAGMFNGCTSLTTAPALPATTLRGSCYQSMFNGCTSLTTAPALPATTLSGSCYQNMFRDCTNLTKTPALPATTLADKCYYCMFYGCTNLTKTPTLPATTLVSNCYSYMFYGCTNLKSIICMCLTYPTSTYASNMLSGVSSTGVFVKNFESEWNSSVGTIPSGWSLVDNNSLNLAITALDVKARKTSTTISYVFGVNVTDETGNTSLFVIETGTAISETFPQNTSYTDTVEREISFTYMGITATTTITQGVWVDQDYEVVLNDNWQMSTEISNPDSTTYDGVYESFSNKGIRNSTSTMYIDIVGYETFGLYIRSNGESGGDYVMVSQLDKTINGKSSYSDTTLVKAHTYGNPQSEIAISNYTYVEFTGIDQDEHRITIVYRKDSSVDKGTDRGYVLIPKINNIL